MPPPAVGDAAQRQAHGDHAQGVGDEEAADGGRAERDHERGHEGQAASPKAAPSHRAHVEDREAPARRTDACKRSRQSARRAVRAGASDSERCDEPGGRGQHEHRLPAQVQRERFRDRGRDRVHAHRGDADDADRLAQPLGRREVDRERGHGVEHHGEAEALDGSQQENERSDRIDPDVAERADRDNAAPSRIRPAPRARGRSRFQPTARSAPRQCQRPR